MKNNNPKIFKLLHDSIFLNQDILINNFNISWKEANKIINYLLKNNLIEKIFSKTYMIKWFRINSYIWYMANFIDPNSYISLYTILEQQIIKQAYQKTFCISTKRHYKVNCYWNEIIYYQSKIPQTFWITFIHKNWKVVRVADKERSFLDLLMIHLFWKTKIHTELYIDSLNKEKIEKYLEYYPLKVKKFYLNGLKQYVKQ